MLVQKKENATAWLENRPGRSNVHAVYGQIIRELKEEAATFQLMEIVHEKREANRDAHSLARSTLFMEVGRYV